ncbi:hypothetical protein CKO11_03450 [Rhodobacter sp. TJ_12]|uniref:MFS transporter n=1 Tax=Rhodobacter sp. TJ_12 TaxID=2029399 RepID=UPI001CBEF0A6|nr:MFS transporter [Rhodobacter sp. TJ_12]MBZ4021512.1 hypothetical protein [Rhodobacter sp. TJ_12]
MTLRHTSLVVLLMLTAIIVVGQLYITIPLTDAIAAQFATEPALAVWSGTAFGFAYAAGFLLWGPLSDRGGRRRVLVLGLVCTGAVTAALSQAHGIEAFLAGRALQGIFAASFPPVALSLLAEVLPPARRPFGISLISFAFLAAAPIAQVIGAALAVPLTAFLLVLAPAYVAMAAGIALVLPAAPAPGAAMAAAPNGVGQGLLRTPLIMLSWGAALTVLFGFVTFQAGTAAGLGGGFDPQLVRLVGLPPLALSLFAAALAKRLGGPTVLARLGLVLAAAGLLLAGLSGPVTLAAAVLVSAGVGLVVPGLIATIAGAASNANRGLALALYTFSLFVGASLAPPVSRALAPLGLWSLYGLAASLLLAAALGLFWGQRRPAQAPQPIQN